LALFGEPDASYVLPSAPSADDKILVNMHPNPDGAGAMAALYAAWGEQQVHAVRSPGGSPSWALVEAAKGHYVYVNLWSKRPAEPFDLAAAALIVRGAGGDIVGLDHQPIGASRHAGPFIAGTRASARQAVAERLGAVLGMP
jgi:fructose-1,6-bisphosphatase/inositol monophosphatase family enzyme